jgi:hypothetical protein
VLGAVTSAKVPAAAAKATPELIRREWSGRGTLIANGIAHSSFQ